MKTKRLPIMFKRKIGKMEDKYTGVTPAAVQGHIALELNTKTKLRKNQSIAIQSSLDSDFTSGVHFHATGTGKSWIALEIALAFNNRYANKHILWVCEHKSILIEQFARETLIQRGYKHLFDKFIVINYAGRKNSQWVDNVNSAMIWNKPILLVINRAYLVSSNNYQKLRAKFGLVIHDECHSVSNKTTQAFYDFFMKKQEDLRCIGFSATPLSGQKPFDKTLSSYTISDAFKDGIVVKPVIRWVNYSEKLSQLDIIKIFRKDIDILPYKKVIVWCGMIEYAKSMAELWSCAYPQSQICLDTSDDSEEVSEFKGYDEFAKSEGNAFLFCACKHREGSDIKNLDCCVFLDRVQERTAKTFVQCVGRVLRLDKSGKKKYGLIIDVRAKSPIEVCDRMNQYINPGNNSFPWDYSFSYGKFNNKVVKLNQLVLRKSPIVNISKNIACEELSVSEDDLVKRFVRPLPKCDVYLRRLRREMDMIIGKDLGHNIVLALEVLDMTKNMPHVTRGSCGSSLVCYLLGISHVDPVKYKISFARFLNQYRNNLPDIDFDFPHMLRDEVFLKLQLRWPGKIARISNHIHFHKKSAIRQALRDNGVSGFVGKYEINDRLRKLSVKDRQKVIKDAEGLEETFRGYSLHCGGVVFFADGIPESLKLPGKDGIIGQVSLNKEDVARDKNFKIDILSSRALSQLYAAKKYRLIDFYANHDDEATSNLISCGDNIGITLAESPLMRKAMLKIRPKCLDDVAACMAIIRPTAKEARDSLIPVDIDNHIIYDDDAIDFIMRALDCDEDLADKYRRAFAKHDKEVINQLKSSLPKNKQPILKKLSCLRKYGFCKAHAYSYAQLVWQLAYCKAHHPIEFWKATLKNCKSFYRKWVHMYEASCVGVNVLTEMSKSDVSIYSDSRSQKDYTLPLIEQLRRYGYWHMSDDLFIPDCCCRRISGDKVYFNGIIACSRLLSLEPGKDSSVVMSLGIGKGEYIEVTANGKLPNVARMVGCKGNGRLTDLVTMSIECYKFEFY